MKYIEVTEELFEILKDFGRKEYAYISLDADELEEDADQVIQNAYDDYIESALLLAYFVTHQEIIEEL